MSSEDDNDIMLNDAAMDLWHARLETSDGKVTAVDLQTDSGTWVHGEKIHGPRPLNDGDTLKIGDWSLQVRFPDLNDRAHPRDRRPHDSSLRPLLT